MSDCQLSLKPTISAFRSFTKIILDCCFSPPRRDSLYPSAVPMSNTSLCCEMSVSWLLADVFYLPVSGLAIVGLVGFLLGLYWDLCILMFYSVLQFQASTDEMPVFVLFLLCGMLICLASCILFQAKSSPIRLLGGTFLILGVVFLAAAIPGYFAALTMCGFSDWLKNLVVFILALFLLLTVFFERFCLRNLLPIVYVSSLKSVLPSDDGRRVFSKSPLWSWSLSCHHLKTLATTQDTQSFPIICSKMSMFELGEMTGYGGFGAPGGFTRPNHESSSIQRFHPR